MALTKQTIEHEFLFRWNEAGTPQGAHIAYREAILENGVEISSRFLDPRPVNLSDASKLEEIGAAIDTAALALNTTQAATIAAMTQSAAEAATAHTSALAQKDADHATAMSEKDAALSQANTALSEALARLAELEPPAVNGVPQQVTMRQAQLALLGAGLLDQVEAAIASIPGDAGRAAQIVWSKSSAVQRTNPLIAQLAGALHLTSEQIDGLFIAAATL